MIRQYGGNGEVEVAPGEPNDILYVKFAENHLKKLHYDKALKCIDTALEMNSNSLVQIILFLKYVFRHIFWTFLDKNLKPEEKSSRTLTKSQKTH